MIARLSALKTTISWLLDDPRKIMTRELTSRQAFEQHLYMPVFTGTSLRQRFSMRLRRVVFLRDPGLMEQVFKSPIRRVDSGKGYSFLKPFFGSESVFVQEGESHLDAKRRVNQFIRKTIDATPAQFGFFSDVVARIFASGEYPVHPRLQAATATFMLRQIFGISDGQSEARMLSNVLGAADSATAPVLMFPAYLRWTRSFGISLQIRRYKANIRRELRKLAASYAPEVATSRFHQFRVRRQLTDNLMTLCIAGFETTGVTLSWLLYELSKNEQLQIDLRAEVRRHQGISMADYLAADNTLLAATVLETLRTHPAIPAVVREVAEEFDLGGRAMCPGDQIVLAIEQMHRAAFSEGELFLPQRWLTRKPETGIATFGGGAKVCPGRAIAMQEARLLTAILVSRFAFESTLRTTGHIRKGSVSATPKDGMVLRVTRIADF